MQETARLDKRRKVRAKVFSELSNRVCDIEKEAEKKRLSLSWKETGEIARRVEQEKSILKMVRVRW